MNANDDDSQQTEDPEPQQPEPQLPNPPEPRKSLEIRAADTNMPDPPPPMLSWEDVPDLDDTQLGR